MYMPSTLETAQHLVNCADETLTLMSATKLNILAYICHGWMLSTHGHGLAAEPIVATKTGPCIPEIDSYTKNGELPVLNDSSWKMSDAREAEIAQNVYDGYSGYSEVELLQMTRVAGTPWQTVWDKDDSGNGIIDDDLIEQHYTSLTTRGGNSLAVGY